MRTPGRRALMALAPALEEIHRSALLAAQEFKQAEVKLLDALVEVEKSGVHLRLGFSSLFTYAVESLGLSEAVAYNAITVARKMREVPELRSEVGEIGISKTRKIVSVLTSENQKEWLEKARTLSSRALEKAVARENPKAATQEVAKYVSEKRLDLRLGVDEELMVKLRRAQDQVSQSTGKPASLEETLREAISFYLRHKDPLEKARRVIPKKGSRAQDRSETLNKLVTGTVHERVPIPAAVEHEVRLRDQNQCQAEKPGGGICGARRWIDLHHLKPVSLGGTNSAENLTVLCRRHHRLIHFGNESS
jgi:hypothetical protein